VSERKTRRRMGTSRSGVEVIDLRDRACFNCKLMVSSERIGGIWNRARVRCFGSGIVLIRYCVICTFAAWLGRGPCMRGMIGRERGGEGMTQLYPLDRCCGYLRDKDG
jgi:hypothetical protein